MTNEEAKAAVMAGSQISNNVYWIWKSGEFFHMECAFCHDEQCCEMDYKSLEEAIGDFDMDEWHVCSNR